MVMVMVVMVLMGMLLLCEAFLQLVSLPRLRWLGGLARKADFVVDGRRISRGAVVSMWALRLGTTPCRDRLEAVVAARTGETLTGSVHVAGRFDSAEDLRQLVGQASG